MYFKTLFKTNVAQVHCFSTFFNATGSFMAYIPCFYWEKFVLY